MTIRFYHNFSSPKIEKIFQCDDMLCVFRFNIPFRHIVFNVFGNAVHFGGVADNAVVISGLLVLFLWGRGAPRRNRIKTNNPSIQYHL